MCFISALKNLSRFLQTSSTNYKLLMDLLSVKPFFSLDSSSVLPVSEERKYCLLLVLFLSFLMLTPLVISESWWWWDTGYLCTV